jgi:hypothetical protein
MPNISCSFHLSTANGALNSTVALGHTDFGDARSFKRLFPEDPYGENLLVHILIFMNLVCKEERMEALRHDIRLLYPFTTFENRASCLHDGRLQRALPYDQPEVQVPVYPTQQPSAREWQKLERDSHDGVLLKPPVDSESESHIILKA